MLKSFAVLFLSAMQGIITAAICLFVYHVDISHYKSVIDLNEESLSQKFVNEKTSDGTPRFNSMETAHKAAEREVANAEKVINSGFLKITLYGAFMVAGMALCGFVTWNLAFVFSRLITKPSQEFDLSTMQIFLKQFLTPTIGVTLLSIYVSPFVTSWIIQQF